MQDCGAITNWLALAVQGGRNVDAGASIEDASLRHGDVLITGASEVCPFPCSCAVHDPYLLCARSAARLCIQMIIIMWMLSPLYGVILGCAMCTCICGMQPVQGACGICPARCLGLSPVDWVVAHAMCCRAWGASVGMFEHRYHRGVGDTHAYAKYVSAHVHTHCEC